MTHSFKVHYFHLIWSTKGRQKWITKEVQYRLYPYLGGIIANHLGQIVEIGGMQDHIHLLLRLPNLDKYSEHVRDLKANSTLFIHRTFFHLREFAWQQGYGSFSVSYSSLESVKDYIRNQDLHHVKMTYEEEYKKFLKCCGVKFDEKFVLG